jgi:hypothetical protein
LAADAGFLASNSAYAKLDGKGVAQRGGTFVSVKLLRKTSLTKKILNVFAISSGWIFCFDLGTRDASLL